MSDFILSTFKKLKEKNRNMDDDADSGLQQEIQNPELMNFYGNTREEQKMTETISANAGSLFAERYGQHIPNKDTILTKISDTIGGIFQAKQFGFFEEGKRANHTKHRIRAQRHLQNEQTMYLARSKDIKRHLSATMDNETLDRLKELYQSPDEKEALKQWMVADIYQIGTEEIETEDLYEKLASQKDNDRGFAMLSILRTLPKKMRPEDFAFGNDMEFVSNFARKYELLSRGACADVFLNQLQSLVEEGKTGLRDSLAEYKATIELCKELKTQYEERMELIRSPYYALLARQDLDVYELPNGQIDEAKLQNEIRANNAGFVDYLRQYLRLKNSPLGKGKDYRAIYNQKLEAIRNQFRDRDVQRVNDSGIDVTKSAEENYYALYEKCRNEYLQKHEGKNALEYLKTTKPQTGVTKILVQEGPDVRRFELLLIEICEKNTINNVPVAKEDVDHIKKFVEETFPMRKNLDTISAGTSAIDDIAYNDAIDVKNPAFKTTPQYAALQALKRIDNRSINDPYLALSAKYMDAVIKEMLAFSSKGYPVYPDYELSVNDEAFINKGVEKYRKNDYEADWYRSHPLKKGEEKKKIDFPSFTVNGRTFCTYGMKGELGILAGLNITLEEKNPHTKEVLTLLPRIEALAKKLTGVKGNYGGCDGKKGYALYSLTTRLNAKRHPMVIKLMNLLRGDVPQVASYMQENPEDFVLNKGESDQNLLDENWTDTIPFLAVPLAKEDEEEDEIRTDSHKEDEIRTDSYKKDDKKLHASDVKNKQKEEELPEEAKDLPQYHVSVNLAVDYEQQTKNNCWCCAGAALFNQFVSVQDKAVPNPLTQEDVRKFRPKEKDLRTLEEIREMGLTVDQELYDNEKKKMYKYMGEYETDFGNLFEAADFFVNKRNDIQMNRMVFTVPALMDADAQKTNEEKQKDAARYRNQLNVFINQVNEVLSAGNAVAMYDSAEQHYITITGLHGNNVTIMNSDPKKGEPMEQTMPLTKLFRRRNHGSAIELNWFSKKEDPNQLTEKFPQLSYNKGIFSTESMTMAEGLSLAHTDGVCATKQGNELGPDMEGIGLSVYVPKYGKKKSRTEKRVIRSIELTERKLKKTDNKVMEPHAEDFDRPQAPLTVEDDAFEQKMFAVETPLFGEKDRVSGMDVKQDEHHSNSFLLATLSGIARKDKDYIRNMVQEMDKDHVKVSLYDEKGIRQTVIVRKSVPDPKLPIWPQLVEKAAAVLTAKKKDDHFDLDSLSKVSTRDASILLFGRMGTAFSVQNDKEGAMGRILAYLSAGKIITATTCKNDPGCEKYNSKKNAVAFPVPLNPLQTHLIIGTGKPIEGESTLTLYDPSKKHTFDLTINLFISCFTDVYVSGTEEQK